MKYYCLAALIWILEIIMFTSIIFIPMVIYLRVRYDWFEEPFGTAEWLLELGEDE